MAIESGSLGDDSGGREFSLDELLRRPARLAELPPCQAGCPSGTDVRRWIGFVAQREKLGLTLDEACRRAFAVVTDKNPFPATMGRICPHPCEGGCNRTEKDGAVAVNALERYLGDWALERGLELARIGEAPFDVSVGVVGAGPAGLSFAYQMARRGWHVVVYERGSRPGGMLLRGIPEFRLPERILVAEIDRILRLGVELVLECPIHRAETLEVLRRTHAALFLGVGAQRGRPLRVPGDDGPGVMTGVDYLRAVNGERAPDLGRRIAVVGGGNTAIDAARAARRQGHEVTLVYRRTRTEMPAEAVEVEEALEEGVELHLLAAPSAVVRDAAGAVRALRLQRMRLGAPDASGRRGSEPIPGETEDLAVEAVLAAVSQGVDAAGLDGLPTTAGYLAAGPRGELADGLWTGGDSTGLGLATVAIAQGRMAAEAVDARLRRLPPPADEPRRPIAAAAVKLDLYAPASRHERPVAPPNERLAEPDLEVRRGLDAGQFVDEAARCLSCGSCFGCAQCAMYCNPAGFTRLDEVAPGAYFAFDLAACEGCGKCIEVCPCGYLSLR